MAKSKRTPSVQKSHAAGSGRGKSSTRYTSPTGRKDPNAAARREAVSGGPRKGTARGSAPRRSPARG